MRPSQGAITSLRVPATPVSLDDLHNLPAVLRVWSPDPQEPTLALVLGLSKAATWAAVHAGQLPARRIGHRWLVPTAELLRWLGVKLDREDAEVLPDGDVEQPETSMSNWRQPLARKS